MLPKFIIVSALYLIKIYKKEKLKSVFLSFIKYFPDSKELANDFWEFKQYKLKDFYLKQRRSSDIVVSASPELLLQPVAKKYKFKLIGTKIDSKSGAIIGKNCQGLEKVKRLKDSKITKCKNYYTDSLSDLSLKEIADNFYIVKGDIITPLDEYKENPIKKTFLNRDFITFLFIGGINVLNGVWISLVYSIFTKSAIVAFIYGFLTSLIISYILNSLFNFKERICASKFLKFVVSNIPNFVIQFLCVFVLINKLNINKALAYFLAALIAVPITFALVRIKVFKVANDKNKS